MPWDSCLGWLVRCDYCIISTYCAAGNASCFGFSFCFCFIVFAHCMCVLTSYTVWFDDVRTAHIHLLERIRARWNWNVFISVDSDCQLMCGGGGGGGEGAGGRWHDYAYMSHWYVAHAAPKQNLNCVKIHLESYNNVQLQFCHGQRYYIIIIYIVDWSVIVLFNQWRQKYKMHDVCVKSNENHKDDERKTRNDVDVEREKKEEEKKPKCRSTEIMTTIGICVTCELLNTLRAICPMRSRSKCLFVQHDYLWIRKILFFFCFFPLNKSERSAVKYKYKYALNELLVLVTRQTTHVDRIILWYLRSHCRPANVRENYIFFRCGVVCSSQTCSATEKFERTIRNINRLETFTNDFHAIERWDGIDVGARKVNFYFYFHLRLH